MDVVVVAVYLLWLWPFFSYLPDQPKIVFHPITITFKSKPPSTPVLSRTINLIRFLLPRNIDFQDDFHGANPVTERFRSNIDIPPPPPQVSRMLVIVFYPIVLFILVRILTSLFLMPIFCIRHLTHLAPHCFSFDVYLIFVVSKTLVDICEFLSHVPTTWV